MSHNRSYIILELTEGEKTKLDTNCNYIGVYCHFNGEKSNVGRTLLTCYNTRREVKNLIKRGYISMLGKTTDDTEFYCRDLKYTKRKTIDLLTDLDEEFYGSTIDYIYVFKKDGWHYAINNKQRKLSFHPLTKRNTCPSADNQAIPLWFSNSLSIKLPNKNQKPKQNIMEKVYVLFTEVNWSDDHYNDVIDVFANREDAVKAYKAKKEEFLTNNAEFIAEIPADKLEQEVCENDLAHFFVLKDLMYDNSFELWIFEKELK